MSGAAIGTSLNGRYRLQAEIGRGGMGLVYRAHDRVLDREVAVKVLSAPRLTSESRARLLREARAVARLAHPNVVTVYDAGESDGLPYVVMELVEGPSLHEEPAHELDEILAVARQLCAALEHAHDQGIVHRDLKPENVLLAADGTAKLVDFGLARTVASRLTTDGAILGTVAYLAPEQALGQEVDVRADLYALGVLLYELVTGRLPFTADDPVAVISQHLYAPVVPPRAHNSAVPRALEALILRLLSKAREDRPASASEVLAALAALDRERQAAPALAAEAIGEELSLLSRIVRGRIVGRERELAQARALWQQAVAGEGQVLLISGEPGVGKTRLVRELAAQVQVTGGRVLFGQCYAEGGPPYAPFAEILRHAFREAEDPATGLPAQVVADLLILAPTLQARFPDVPPNPPLDPQSEQQRILENTATFFAHLSQERPLLLVVEDAHWAGSGTLALLRHLARRTRRRHLLLVSTYREAELDASRPFHSALADLNRERLATRLKVPPLTLEGTRKLLMTLFDDEITDEFNAGIYRETEGNPFFVEEVCKALVDSGQLYFAGGEWHRPSMEELGIPQNVRLAIQSRLARLPEEAQEVLQLAAVVGREFQFDVLAAAADRGDEALVLALESAEGAQLVQEVSGRAGGTFSFAHALIPATLAEGLSGLRRRRLHRRVLGALQRLRPNDFEALAHHAHHAGDLEAGLEFSLRAAEKARRLSALDEALFHYERALEVAQVLEVPDRLLDIYEAIGEVHHIRGDAQAVAAFEQALALASDPRRRAAIKAKIGTIDILLGGGRCLDYLEQAIGEMDPESQRDDRAQAIAAIGRYHHNHARHRQAIEHLDRARQIAEVDGQPGTLTFVYAYLAGAYQHLAEIEASTAWARQLLALGERGGHPHATCIGHEYLAEDACIMGHWRRGLEQAELERQIAAGTGLAARVAWSHYSKAMAHLGLGDLRAAEDAARAALERADTLRDLRLGTLASAILATILLDRGQPDAAEALAHDAVQRAAALDQIYLRCLGIDALAGWRARQGEWVAAAALYEDCAGLRAGTDNYGVLLAVGPSHGHALLRAGQSERAGEVIEATLALARSAPSPHSEASALRVRAQILARRREAEAAFDAFDRAIDALEALESRLELGRAWYYRGRVAAEFGAGDAARDALGRAAELFEACGAPPWVERARRAAEALA
ncbi:MAG: protein kinase domain-containing protein [Anaerolineae bacterium]